MNAAHPTPPPPVPPLTPAQKIDAAVSSALDLLAQTLQFQHSTAVNHRLLVVTGWNQTSNVRRAVAEYLVGLCVMAVNSVLAVRTDLVGPSGLAEAKQNVEAIIGLNGGGLTADQIVKRRNPWLAEGLWHLCLAVSMRVPGSHPPGQLFALSLPHADATEHGVDLAALYHAPGGIGLSMVETKAYCNRPADAIRDSARFFRKINAGIYRKKIREAVLRMRAECPNNLQPQITAQLWEERRWYIPNPHYDDSHVEDWMQPRSVLVNLLKAPAIPPIPVPQGVLIMPHAVAGFDVFFNDLSSDMMTFVNSL
jgi:hypothetical protein